MKQIVVVAVLVFLGYLGFKRFFVNEQAVIKSRLVQLEIWVAEHEDVRQVSIFQFKSLLDDYAADAIVASYIAPGGEKQSIQGKEAILGALKMVSARLTKVKAKWVDMNIQVDPERKKALVDVTLQGEINGQGEEDVAGQIEMEKRDGTWLITKVSQVPLLN